MRDQIEDFESFELTDEEVEGVVGGVDLNPNWDSYRARGTSGGF